MGEWNGFDGGPLPALRHYQLEASAHLANARRCIEADAPGSGKTATIVSAVDAIDSWPVIIVCPLAGGLITNHWAKEIRAWAQQPVEIFMATGSAKQRRTAWSHAATCAGRYAVITNYEAARADIAWLQASQAKTLVLDEAHRVKNHRSKSFDALKRVAASRPVFFAVTGTPILNRIEELWTLLHMIDPKRWPSFWRFVERYCETEVTNFNGRVRTPVRIITGAKPGMEVVLRQELAGVMVRRPLEDLLPELPEITRTTYEIDLSPTERRVYDQMADFYFTQFADGSQIIAPNEVSKITRLRQLANDVSLLGPGEGKLSSKLAALRDLVDDLFPEPVVIFSDFAQVAEKAASLLGGAYITGNVPAKARTEIVDTFVAGNIRVLCGTIGAIGEGVDSLQRAAHHLIFIDQDWTPARNEQAIARVHRYGQKERVFVHVLTARGTVDEYVTKTLERKERVIDSIVGLEWDAIAKGGRR